MNTIVILLGTEDSGKSGTIKKFFEWIKNRSIDFKIMNLKGKCTPVFVVYHGSPQELDYSRNVSGVWKKIKKRLEYCKRETKEELGLDCFVLLLPFTMQYKNHMINEDCILEPIKKLRQNQYTVHIVHLKGGISGYNPEAEAFVTAKVIVDKTIKSRNNEKEQAKELKEFIKNMSV